MIRVVLLLSWMLATPAMALSPCADADPSTPWDRGELNDTARVLAGLRTPLDSNLKDRLGEGSLKRHQATLGDGWTALRARQLDAVRAFGETDSPKTSRVFYPFSGPDALYLLALFPEVEQSLLTGLEPVGLVPQLASLSADEIEAGLADIRQSLNAILSFSFFRTNDLTVDLKRSRFVGVTPILFVFLAEAGYAVIDVNYLWLPPDGSLCAADAAQAAAPPKGTLAGVAIDYFKPGDLKFRRMTYFTADLGDGGLTRTPQYLDFVQQFAADGTYLKSASYLLHKTYFSKIRGAILQTGFVMQDDSGVPHRWFASGDWSTTLYGRYQSPIALFANWHQRELAADYKTIGAEELSFGIGYRHRRNDSNLQIYRRADAVVAEDTAP